MESTSTEPTMDDLPELPFEKVLSYLSLEDRIKARAVSRRWYTVINSFRVKTLCYSDHPSGFIREKNRWVSGAFAENFISSRLSKRFFISSCPSERFFDTFGRSMLSNLKRLHLVDIDVDVYGRAPVFPSALSSFGQLEELAIVRFQHYDHNPQAEFKLILPMLHSIHLEDLSGIKVMTLDAPKLKKVKTKNSSTDHLRLELVHAESVETLVSSFDQLSMVKRMKNLRYYYPSFYHFYGPNDQTFLSSLEHLKEIHLQSSYNVNELFQQKQLHGRTDLKIFLCGLLLDGPDDSAIGSLDFRNESTFGRLAESSARLADEIPLHDLLLYEEIEPVAPQLAINLLKRFVDLKSIRLFDRVQDVQRFLDLLKSFDVVELSFNGGQPQELFDRLPEHCAVQKLAIDAEDDHPPEDISFLFRLKHLIRLDLSSIQPIDVQFVRKVLTKFEFLSFFMISNTNINKGMEIAIRYPKRFEIWIVNEYDEVADLEAAMQFITEHITDPDKED